MKNKPTKQESAHYLKEFQTVIDERTLFDDLIFDLYQNGVPMNLFELDSTERLGHCAVIPFVVRSNILFSLVNDLSCRNVYTPFLILARNHIDK